MCQFALSTRFPLYCLSGALLVVMACGGTEATHTETRGGRYDVWQEGGPDPGSGEGPQLLASELSSEFYEQDDSQEQESTAAEVICFEQVIWFKDGDWDGYPAYSQKGADWLGLCPNAPEPPGYAKENPGGWDCDDEDGEVFPGATEECDDVDNDCDGKTDEGLLYISYLDEDGDGYGSSQSTVSCEVAQNHALNKGDCEDGNAQVHPGAAELCDHKDNDCDGETDEELGVGEECSKGVGLCLSWGLVVCTEQQTAECNALEIGAQVEICDWADNDCDGKVDEGLTESIPCGTDDVGACTMGSVYRYCVEGEYAPWTPCDAVEPSMEVCDGVDNDCDGKVDEFLDVQQPCGSSNLGECEYGLEQNLCLGGVYSGWIGCDAITPVDEVCDDLDNDCDGDIDEGLKDTYYLDSDGDTFGTPLFITQSCQPLPGWVEVPGDCDDLKPLINPAALEVCDGVDNNCDGDVDFGWECCDIGDWGDSQLCPPGDVIFLVDNSGSMDDNDPGGIRYTGLKKIVSMMKPTDRAMVMTFADIALAAGSFTSDQQELEEQLVDAQFSSVGSWTYIGSALAKTAFPAFENNGMTRTIILLTDGATSTDDLIYYPAEFLKQLAVDKEIDIYTIGLGQVEEDYLSTLSNGKYVHVNLADQIPAVYQKVYSLSLASYWQECSEDHKWVEKTGECAVDCPAEVMPGFFFADDDEDGWGVFDSLDSIVSGCEPPDKFSPKYGDCDDTLPAVCPDCLELCDGLDNNCNQQIDEQVVSTCFAPDGCIAGTKTCQNSAWGPCDAPPLQAESCDGLDNDCDGLTDETMQQPCSTVCGEGVETCVSAMWGNCDAPVVLPEVPDGLDNDCDGEVDEEETCWQAVFGGSFDDYGYRIAQVPDGGYLVVGAKSVGGGWNPYDLLVAKLNSAGVVEWDHTAGGAKTELATGLHAMQDGGFIVAGQTASFGAGMSDGWVRVYAADGTLAIENFLGTAWSDILRDVEQTSDGRFIAAGYAKAPSSYHDAGWVVRLDNQAQMIWQIHFEASNDRRFESVSALDDGGFLLTGSDHYLFSSDAYVLRTNADGAEQWSLTVGKSWYDDQSMDGIEFLHSQSQQRRYAVVGKTKSSGAGSGDGLLLILDDSGGLLTQKTFGTSEDDSFTHVVEVTDYKTGQPALAICGFKHSSYWTYSEAWFLMVNQDGELLSETSFDGGSIGDDNAYSVIPTMDGGFALAGSTDSLGSGKSDIWVLKLNALGQPDCDAVP